MTNLRWMKWAITRHFRSKGLQVQMRSIRLGNVAIDGEVLGKGWKMALELKTPRDDVTRGIGQLAEALAYGYNEVALVTTMRAARNIDSKVFDKLGLVLLGVDSKGNVRQVYPTYAA
ncbi:MAG: hypothetical protein ABSC50_02605 [Candidatus Bathyarchaeia archaeon]